MQGRVGDEAEVLAHIAAHTGVSHLPYGPVEAPATAETVWKDVVWPTWGTGGNRALREAEEAETVERPPDPRRPNRGTAISMDLRRRPNGTSISHFDLLIESWNALRAAEKDERRRECREYGHQWTTATLKGTPIYVVCRHCVQYRDRDVP